MHCKQFLEYYMKLGLKISSENYTTFNKKTYNTAIHKTSDSFLFIFPLSLLYTCMYRYLSFAKPDLFQHKQLFKIFSERIVVMEKKKQK